MGILGGTVNIKFSTPYKDANYSVTLTSTYTGAYFGSVRLAVKNKTKDGFTIQLWNESSTKISNVSFDWISVAN